MSLSQAFLVSLTEASPGHAHRIEANQDWQEDICVIHAVVHLACHKGHLRVARKEGMIKEAPLSVSRDPHGT